MINIGIVGCGYWGINYVRVFNELSGVSVRRVCDVSDQRLHMVHNRFPDVFPGSVLKDLLSDPEIDAVVIATPAADHYATVKASLLYDKHVLVEKPLTTRVEEAEELVELAKERECTLMVGHTFLYNPGIAKIKECVDDSDFGTIYYLHATRTHLGLIREDVNAMWDLAPHDISIFSFLLDKQPLWASAVAGTFLNGRPDVGFINLGYPDGVVGNIHVSWIDSNKVREVVVVGSKKRVVFNDLNNLERIRIYEKGASVSADVNSFGEFQLQLRDGDIISPSFETSEPLKNQCMHFMDCVANGNAPLSGGDKGLDVVRVMAAIDRSVEQRGTAVEIVQ
ncbi:MAG: Gfo/Idh/MocA family oxidoreductase [Deltaproteobacteria bacterium]|nr:Gfo/Idh/MocA family oxidoreductase [Deltaproteobacteria bacterium]